VRRSQCAEGNVREELGEIATAGDGSESLGGGSGLCGGIADYA
jgi:hypothetical protein